MLCNLSHWMQKRRNPLAVVVNECIDEISLFIRLCFSSLCFVCWVDGMVVVDDVFFLISFLYISRCVVLWELGCSELVWFCTTTKQLKRFISVAFNIHFDYCLCALWCFVLTCLIKIIVLQLIYAHTHTPHERKCVKCERKVLYVQAIFIVDTIERID